MMEGNEWKSSSYKWIAEKKLFTKKGRKKKWLKLFQEEINVPKFRFIYFSKSYHRILAQETHEHLYN